MKYAVWILQILLALSFGSAGVTKLLVPRAQLIESGQTWAADFSDTQVKLIGVAETAGAIGVIVPAATGIAPMLTPAAAFGLALVMGGAIATHMRRGEAPMALPAIVLSLLALLTAVLTYRRYSRRP